MAADNPLKGQSSHQTRGASQRRDHGRLAAAMRPDRPSLSAILAPAAGLMGYCRHRPSPDSDSDATASATDWPFGLVDAHPWANGGNHSLSDPARLLVIVNFIPPYDAEVASLLGAPKYGRVRFRYQSKYLPTIAKVPTIAGRHGTVVLRDRATGWFMPLRSFRAVTARLVGDVVHVTAELLDTAAVSGVESTRDSQVAQFNQAIATAIGSFPNAPSSDLKNLILFESGAVAGLLATWRETSTGDDVTHWGECVRLIDSHFPALDLDFFRVVALQNASGGAVEVEVKRDGQYGYPVAPGNDYTLEIIQRTYTGRKGDSSVATARYIELEASHESVTIHPRTQPILGKYDFVAFNLYLKDNTSATTKLALLSVVRPETSQRYGIELPLLPRRRRSALILRATFIFLFFVALGAYLGSTVVADVLENAPGLRGEDVDPDGIEKGAIIGMLLFANASGLTQWIASRTELS